MAARKVFKVEQGKSASTSPPTRLGLSDKTAQAVLVESEVSELVGGLMGGWIGWSAETRQAAGESRPCFCVFDAGYPICSSIKHASYPVVLVAVHLCSIKTATKERDTENANILTGESCGRLLELFQVSSFY